MSVKQYLELLESSGIETNDKDTAKLDKLSNDDGLIERSEFLSYAKKSHVFKSLQEELEKQHYDKAELAFKVCIVVFTMQEYFYFSNPYFNIHKVNNQYCCLCNQN